MQTMYRFFSLCGLAALTALSFAPRPAAAQTIYFPDSTTINYLVDADAYVGYSESYALSSPTVNLVRGGEVTGDLEVYNSSVVNVSGGIADDLLWSFGSSTINVSGGAVGSYLDVTQNSNANVSGGTFGQYKGVNFADSTTGTFTFVGSHLSYAPDPAGQTPFGGSDYTLTGVLQNGQSVTNDVVEVASGAQMFTISNSVAAPEPSQGALLGLVILGTAWRLFKARRRGSLV